jgi:ribosomal protein L7/L12
MEGKVAGLHVYLTDDGKVTLEHSALVEILDINKRLSEQVTQLSEDLNVAEAQVRLLSNNGGLSESRDEMRVLLRLLNDGYLHAAREKNSRGEKIAAIKSVRDTYCWKMGKNPSLRTAKEFVERPGF